MKKTRKRRKFTSEFKARVALEAARGMRTVNEIAADNELHPNQVSAWKKELLEGAAGVFEGGGEARRSEEAMEKERARYERKIGQLTIENDWLQKKSKELGL
jgi:transposase-like protein